jgi:hypothetical protein
MNPNNEIVFRIAGGLGNQFFMYCAGVYFQQKFQRNVVFDISDLNRIKILHAGLNILDLGLLDEHNTKTYQVFSWKKYDFWKTKKSYEKIWDRLLNLANLSKSYRPSEIGFVDLSKIPARTKAIEGYFQTWKFHAEINQKPLISSDSLTNPTQWFLDNALLIRQGPVAVFHVRRGDYASLENRAFGMLSLAFFKKTSWMIPDHFERWIFTDSPEALEKDLESMGTQFKLIVPPDNSDPIESLLLMSMASYIVISNSTYSWWAATLAGKNATVYAPSKWFQHRADPVDLLPNAWIKIPSEWEIGQ